MLTYLGILDPHDAAKLAKDGARRLRYLGPATRALEYDVHRRHSNFPDGLGLDLDLWLNNSEKRNISPRRDDEHGSRCPEFLQGVAAMHVASKRKRYLHLHLHQTPSCHV